MGWTIRRSNPSEGKGFLWGSLSLLFNGYRRSFPGLKRPWGDTDHLLPSSAELKNCVELYLCSPIYLTTCVNPGAWACTSAYVRVALLSQHAPYCGISVSTTFFHIYLINGATFGKKLLKIKCVFSFSLQLIFEIFLIIRKIQRDSVINVKTSSCKAHTILVGF
jgi:hypothetical protein